MTAYVIFDVEISDPIRYQEFMTGVKPALEQAGAKYLARGGEHKVYEGDWEPRRIVLVEFPSVDAWESFYSGSTYQRLKAIRDECSSARLVSVVGLSCPGLAKSPHAKPAQGSESRKKAREHDLRSIATNAVSFCATNSRRLRSC